LSQPLVTLDDTLPSCRATPAYAAYEDAGAAAAADEVHTDITPAMTLKAITPCRGHYADTLITAVISVSDRMIRLRFYADTQPLTQIDARAYATPYAIVEPARCAERRQCLDYDG